MRLHSWRAVCVLLQLVVLVSGCTSWQVQSAPVPEILAQQHPRRLRVTQADGTPVILENPQVRNDSLIGSSATSADTAGATRALALADISQVAIRRTNTARTVLLVGGILAALGIATAIVVHEIVESSD